MNKKTQMIIVAVALVAVSFFGGVMYGKSQAPAGRSGTGTFTGAGGTGNRMMRGGAGGGITSGEVLSKDATSVTLKLRDGGSKLVMVSGSTLVMKSTAGTLNDLSVGEQVSVVGTVNSDGNTITAQSIQIRPATTTRAN
ncbi:MAG: hypothetical protein WCK48_01555 [bacterium]